MNAITGMSELLLRRELPGDARFEVQDIKQAAANLISIINDILDFSKVEAGKLEIIPVNYMLSSLVNDIANIIRMQLMGKPIQLFSNIDSNIPNNLVGDEVRLRQIILNLLSNAAKFTDKGHISLSITPTESPLHQLDFKQDPDGNSATIWLKIAICDTGHGIKYEDQTKLFLNFAQVATEKNRSIEGTGLGLAITKRLCVAMGGDIELESEFGKGSTFTAIIPQGIESEEVLAAEVKPEQKEAHVYKAPFTIPQARLLVVDDIATNLKVAEGLLAPYKATVDISLSGAEAIELIKQRAKFGESYDLIFMDHMMPEMDGVETTEIIRAWEIEEYEKQFENDVEFAKQTPKLSESQIPIVALTANAVSGMREMFLENGFNDFLAKPIDVSELDEVLDRWIVQEIRTDSSREKIKVKSEEKKEKRLVLLVDDNPSNLRLGINVLRKTYNIITAPSTEKMSSLLESNSPNIILLGVGMQQHITSTKQAADIPVIFLTEPFDPIGLINSIDNYFLEQIL
jgi:CheY-like chemotaxis protein